MESGNEERGGIPGRGGGGVILCVEGSLPGGGGKKTQTESSLAPTSLSVTGAASVGVPAEFMALVAGVRQGGRGEREREGVGEEEGEGEGEGL